MANNTVGGPLGAREVQIEGLNAAGGLGLYGNCAASALFPSSCDDDDSGPLDLRLDPLRRLQPLANNEINGLTLGAVGRETDIDNVEVFQSKDDAIEMFGGTVNLKHARLMAPGDDGTDYDEGYRGKVQFIALFQGTPGTDKSDKGGELDGGNVGDGSLPRAIPTVYNTTYVGLGAQKNFTAFGENTALHFRDNSGGRWYNSAFLDFGGAEALIEGGTASPNSANTAGERAGTAYVVNTGHCSVTTATVCTTTAQCLAGEVCVNDQKGPASTFELELEDNTFYCIHRQESLLGGGFPVGSPPAGRDGHAGGLQHRRGAVPDGGHLPGRRVVRRRSGGLRHHASGRRQQAPPRQRHAHQCRARQHLHLVRFSPANPRADPRQQRPGDAAEPKESPPSTHAPPPAARC